jgi:hypothetical protein
VFARPRPFPLARSYAGRANIIATTERDYNRRDKNVLALANFFLNVDF